MRRPLSRPISAALAADTLDRAGPSGPGPTLIVVEIASAYIFGLIGAGFAFRLLWPKKR